MTLDYDAVAVEYARHRRPYDGLVDHLAARSGAGPGSAVLEVGCGTANHLADLVAATGAAGTGVDPSAGMLRAAADHPVEMALSVDRAEDLGRFDDASFDLVLSVDMIHWVPRPEEYFANVARILRPGGLVCTATDTEEIIRNREPVSRVFPATVPVELARVPGLERLRAAMTAHGLTPEGEQVVGGSYELTDAQKYADKAYSCLHLIPEEDFEAGLRTLREELARGPITATLRTCAVWGSRAR